MSIFCPGTIHENRSPAAWLIAVLLALPTILLLLLILSMCERGFDFTDEGFFLNSIARPWLNPFSVTQFGFIYHPLYRLVDTDIALLRQANILITVSLAVYVNMLAIRRSAPSIGWPMTLGLAIALAGSVFGACNSWIVTPSYNWLNLQGLLLTLIGILHLEASPQQQVAAKGAIIIGIGGVVVFLAKPTSAIVLAVVVLVFIVFRSRHVLKHIAIAVATSLVLLLIAALAIDGSPITFFQRLAKGLELAVLLTNQYAAKGVMQLDGDRILPLGGGRIKLDDIVGFVAFFAGGALLALVGRARSATSFVLAASCLLVAVSLILLFDVVPPLKSESSARPAWFVAGPVGLAMAAIWLGWSNSIEIIKRVCVPTAILCATLPFAYAFGSTVNIWKLALTAPIFWIVGAVIILSSLAPSAYHEKLLANLAIGTSLVAILIVKSSIDHPRRLPTSLAQQHSPVVIGYGPRSGLLVDGATAEYLGKLQDDAKNAGFKRGTAILDFTGGHPGTVFAVAGSAPGPAWMLGGYPGSEALADEHFRYIDCKILEGAWLLVAPDGGRRLPESLLLTGGRSFAADYDQVGSGREPLEGRRHLLMKPKSTARAMARCGRKRN